MNKLNMLLKCSRVFLLPLTLSLSPYCHAGPAVETALNCVAIDGPAHLREKPNGKILKDLPQNALVEILETKSPWYKVGTRNNGRGQFTCSINDLGSFPIEGWTHEKNIRRLTGVELAKTDPCAFNETTFGKDVFSAEVNQQICSCAEFSQPHHYATQCDQKILARGISMGADCLKGKDFTTCKTSRQDVEGATTLQCPNTCLSLKISKELLVDDRIKQLKANGEKNKENYKKVLPLDLYNEIQNSYPAWVPYFEDKMASKYEIKLELIPFHLHVNLTDKKEELWIVLFFEKPEDFIQDKPTWLFWKASGGKQLKVWSAQVPYTLKPQYNEGNTQLCLIQTRGPKVTQVLVADTPIDEWHLPQGAYSLSDVFEKGPVLISNLKDAKKSAAELEAGYGIKNFDDTPMRILPECLPMKM